MCTEANGKFRLTRSTKALTLAAATRRSQHGEMLRRVLPHLVELRKSLSATCLALALLVLASVCLAQKPPPADVDALAREAAEFTRGRRLGAAWLWGSLIVASVIIGWVRGRARRAAAKAAKSERGVP